jgi:hypothetical protein
MIGRACPRSIRRRQRWAAQRTNQRRGAASTAAPPRRRQRARGPRQRSHTRCRPGSTSPRRPPGGRSRRRPSARAQWRVAPCRPRAGRGSPARRSRAPWAGRDGCRISGMIFFSLGICGFRRVSFSGFLEWPRSAHLRRPFEAIGPARCGAHVVGDRPCSTPATRSGRSLAVFKRLPSKGWSRNHPCRTFMAWARPFRSNRQRSFGWPG